MKRALAAATLAAAAMWNGLACEQIAGIRERDLVAAVPDADVTEVSPTTEGGSARTIAEGIRVVRFAVDAEYLFVAERIPSAGPPAAASGRVVRVSRATGEELDVAKGSDEGTSPVTDVVLTPKRVYWLMFRGRYLWWRTKDLGIPVQSTFDTDPRRDIYPRGFWGATSTGRIYFDGMGEQLCVFDETNGFSVSDQGELAVAAADEERAFAVSHEGSVYAGSVGALVPIAQYGRSRANLIVAPALDARRFYWFDGSGVPGESGSIYAVARDGGAVAPILDGVRSPVRIVSDGTTLFVLSLGYVSDDRALTDGELRTCSVDACAATVRTVRSGLHGASWLQIFGDDVFWSEVGEGGSESGGAVRTLPKRDL